MNIYEVELKNGKIIEFELIRKNVKNINLTIRPDFSITLSANKDVPVEIINDYLYSKTNWITNRLGKFRETESENLVKPEYVSGESFKFLGKQYRLEVNYTSINERVILEDEYIKLFVKNKDKLTTKVRLIDEWYRKEADDKFSESLDKMYEVIKGYGIDKPKLDFKIMTKRWGSCLKSKKTIQLNLELIKAPMYCIDYVVLHELIHFIHKNHDSKFYDILTVLMPDWKLRKEILDQEIVLFV